MRDLSKMADLRCEAPLAQFESEEWSDFSEYNHTQDVENSNKETECVREALDNVSVDHFSENFTETFSGSLEDLVNTFDEKITKCFCNYDEKVEKYAPVQVRSQEEIMNECQMWWTITGNFGNILPIDWSKSYARELHLPTLNLNEKQDKEATEEETTLSDEDEAVASDLDLHSLILSGPIKTADEVIKEIDDLMQESTSTEGSAESESETIETPDSPPKQATNFVPMLGSSKLQSFSLTELNEYVMELEMMTKAFSETLISELALRDELEFEKELKNQFISLLLTVQSKRRQFYTEKKKLRGARVNGMDPKYLTTLIPYHMEAGPPETANLQILIKILKAINDDSPTVPVLLTDYILKVLCPS